jgi:hypothetical protein
MEDYEKEAFLYSFLDYSNDSGGTGPKDILRPIIQRSIFLLDKKIFSLDELALAIEKDFGKAIDLLVIKTELSRLQVNHEVSYDRISKKYTYQNSVNDYQEAYNKSKNSGDIFQRKLKEYVDSITEKYIGLTTSKVFKYFCSFIQYNMLEFVKLMAEKEKLQPMTHHSDLTKVIEKFIFDEVLQNKLLYESFECIFNGIMLLYIYINCNSMFQEKNPFGRKFFYLDTNIVLRILELQDVIQNKMGEELRIYLKDNNFTIAITGDTWQEICSLINGYKYNYNRIYAKGNVSHIYQVMKWKDIIPEGVEDFLNEIHKKLKDEGIIIEDIIHIKPNDYAEIDKLKDMLAKKKYENKCDLLGEVFDSNVDIPELYIRQADHDLRNVFNIIYLRKGIKNFEFTNEVYYFVTADYTLRTFVKDNIPKNGQAYVIGDSTLAFLLYYKNPQNSKGFSVQSFINAHFESRKLSIKNWYIYYDLVKEKYKNSQITKEQAGYLLSKIILDNEKFATSGVEEIIESAIEIYEKREEKYNTVLRENENYSKLYETMSKDLSENTKKISSLEFEARDSKSKSMQLTEKVTIQEKEIKSQKTAIRLVCGLLIILAAALFFSNNILFGSITSLFSFFLFVFDLIKNWKNR